MNTATASPGRVLNDKQHRALDRLADVLPSARVSGWIQDPDVGRGPVIVSPDGSRVLVNFTGYTKKIP